MLSDKDRFSEILLDEKNEIEELKRNIKDKASLSSDIKRIRSELGVIEQELKPMENELNKEIKRIKDLDAKVKQFNFDVESENIDTLVRIIRKNLPDGSGGIEISEVYDENNLKSIDLSYKQTTKTNITKDKENHIGKISILETIDKQFEVDVTLGDKADSNFKEAKFIIPNFLRIYKIIAWLNTNLHYNE